MSRLKRALFRLYSRLPWLKRLLPGFAKRALFRRVYNHPPAHAPYQPGVLPAGATLFGYLSAPLGLGQGARLYRQALDHTGLPVAQVDVSFLLDGNRGAGRVTPKQAPYAVNLMHLNPDLLPLLYQAAEAGVWDDRYQVGIWLWELERLPASWLPWLAAFDEFWAPSRFIAEALRRDTGLPVTYMPYGIEAPVEPGVGRAAFGLPEDAFLVLCMFDVRSFLSRKNPEAAIRAFEAAFAGEENAMLVLKTHGATDADLDRLRGFTGESNRVRVLCADLEKPRLNALIACCDTLISMHRSEGFGLVLAEAMLLGMPVVATGWSANTDFMDEKCACMVQYTLVPTGDAYLGASQGQRWAEPSVDDAAGWLRRLYREPSFRRAIAEAGQQRIAQEFSTETCAARMRERLSHIIKDPPS